MALLGRMATSLAHEIHNPVSAIRMHAQLLQSAPPAELPSAAADFVPTLLEETGRIESLVNQWMYLTCPQPPSTSVFPLGQLVTQTLQAQSAATRHAEVTVKSDIPPELNILGDRRRLSQAIANAIVNACQAMPHGGLLEISATAAESSIALTFHDHGAGFSPEALMRHRELFYSEKEGGMGIGLSVTAEVLEAHGGRLEVSNSPAGGALVTFQLPTGNFCNPQSAIRNPQSI